MMGTGEHDAVKQWGLAVLCSKHLLDVFSLQDVARLIVERSTIMSHLFSKLSYSAESDAVLVALLSIFSRYIKRMRQSKEGEEVYSWVSASCLPQQLTGTGQVNRTEALNGLLNLNKPSPAEEFPDLKIIGL